MDKCILNRMAMIAVLGTALGTTSLPSHADPHSQGANQQGHEKSQEKQAEKAEKKAHQQQHRLSQEQQQARIRQQQERLAQYRRKLAEQQAIAQRQAQLLEQQRRIAHYRFQQSYYERLRQQAAELPDDRYDYNNDPFYYTAPSYRYSRDGREYATNQYGADTLRKALDYGYREGLQAGRADRQDNWRFDYGHSFAYEDANYGYDGRYVEQNDYNHYFREGFQRGYENSYYERRQYGGDNGSDSLPSGVAETILRLEALH